MYPNVNRFPKILLQLPYLFNNANYTDYFKAYNQMYLDILQSQNYSNISLMNLSSGANTILYYESNDKIHINQAATANLFTLMQKAITPTIPNDIQCNSSGTTINVT
jgi:hypothetical protein